VRPAPWESNSCRPQRGTWTVVVAPGSDFDVSVIGTVSPEAIAKICAADLASGLALGSGLVSDLDGVNVTGTLRPRPSHSLAGRSLAGGFGFGLALRLEVDLGSVLGSALDGAGEASATNGAPCCTDAAAMWSWISSRMRSSRLAGAAAAENHGQEITIVAMHRGHDIETGGRDIAGLDAVDAVDAAQRRLWLPIDSPRKLERAGREIFVIAREAFLDGAAQKGLIARGRDLLVVRQARGIAIDVCAMPSACALRVMSLAKDSSSPPMFSATTTAASLAERVTMP